MKVFIVFFGILVCIPIGFYLQFQIMTRVNATDAMWIMFWINLPFAVLIQIFTKILEAVDKKS